MIGPGTGVAPMRSLIQERHALYAAEKQSPTSETMYLFFGCRHEHKVCPHDVGFAMDLIETTVGFYLLGRVSTVSRERFTAAVDGIFA